MSLTENGLDAGVFIIEYMGEKHIASYKSGFFMINGSDNKIPLSLITYYKEI